MRTLPRLAALALVTALLASRLGAEEAPATGGVRVLEHDLTVRLLPSERRLVGEDRLTVEAPAAGGSLVLELHPALAVTGPVEVGSAAVTPAREGARLAGLTLPGGRSTVVVRYAGALTDADAGAGDALGAAGGRARGLVSPRGVHLSGTFSWVPRAPGEGPARYAVRAFVPDPFHVVTQGALPTRGHLTSAGAPGDGAAVEPEPAGKGHAGRSTEWNTLTAKAVVPSDGLALVAGPYQTQSRVVDGVTLATWFHEREAPDAPLWLDAMAEVVKRYGRLLGPYPHPKFDLVASPTGSAAGAPSFALLGDAALRSMTAGAKRAGGKVPPGALDAAVVRGWYGHGVLVDPAGGSWSEGLRAYVTGAWAREAENPGEGLAYRRRVLERFALRVKGERDQPVRRFVSNAEDADDEGVGDDVGSGKASLIFHLARRSLGDKLFAKTLKDVTQASVGRRISWDDWFAAFDAAAGKPVGAALRPYLERAGLPELSRVSAAVSPAEGGRHKVTLAAEQGQALDGGGPWPVSVEVLLDGVVGEGRVQTLDLSSGKATLEVTVSTPPRRVVFDGGYHAPRRIAETDLPPSLERTLAAGAGVVVLAGGGEATLRPLAERIAARNGFRVAGPELNLEGFAGPALVLGVAPKGRSPLAVGGATYDDPQVATLVSSADGGRLRTVFTALSEEAAEQAGRLAPYGTDPWVVLAGGRPLARAPRTDERPSTVVALNAAPTTPAARVKADLEQLCSPAFEGRWPGSKGHDLCRQWLAEQARAWAGGDPARTTLLSRFRILNLARTTSRDLTLVPDEGEPEVLKDAFRPFSFSPVRDPSFQPPQGCEVVPWSGTDALALAQDANGREAGILAYALTPEAAAALAPFLDTVEDLTPEAQAELSKAGLDGKKRPRPPLGPWIAGRRARLAPGLVAVDRTVIAVTPAMGERLKAALEAERRVQVAVDFGPAVEGTSVVAASFPIAAGPSAPGAGKPPVVVLMAHYDAFGQQGDVLWAGADDNASGVAAVLEALRGLPGQELAPAEGRPGVVVVFSDAEEWGQRGAYEAVKDLGELVEVRAVINLDSVGRAGSAPTRVIGATRHAGLGALVAAALKAEGLALGPDVDASAYEHGGDHWPFHLEGIPALTLTATDDALRRTAGDALAKVEPEGVARIAAALVRLLRESLPALGALPRAH